MLLTLTATAPAARDLGFLLKKHPDRVQTFPLGFGAAHVFYPEADDERCTAALLLDVDPVSLVRGRPTASGEGGLVDAYVNDRPYVASSFLSVAISRVLGTALGGRSEPPELALRERSLEAVVTPVRTADETLPAALFVPLGYEVELGAGSGRHRALRLRAITTLQRLLTHLYVLVPVLDDQKHYWVGDEELEKLLRFGADWLAAHPARELITRRYLRRAPGLARTALDRLAALADDGGGPAAPAAPGGEAALERPQRLQERRIAAVVEVLRAHEAHSVVDLGCGDGDLVLALAREPGITRLSGADVSSRELERAAERLARAPLPLSARERVALFQSSLLYTDRRVAGFDAATVIEVVEHLDAGRLAAFERALFGAARPRTAVVTTPNREYNALFPALAPGALRHPDHRFEWTRAEFGAWAAAAAAAYGYEVAFAPIGDEDPVHGAPTQMAVFRCA